MIMDDENYVEGSSVYRALLSNQDVCNTEHIRMSHNCDFLLRLVVIIFSGGRYTPLTGSIIRHVGIELIR